MAPENNPCICGVSGNSSFWGARDGSVRFQWVDPLGSIGGKGGGLFSETRKRTLLLWVFLKRLGLHHTWLLLHAFFFVTASPSLSKKRVPTPKEAQLSAKHRAAAKAMSQFSMSSMSSANNAREMMSSTQSTQIQSSRRLTIYLYTCIL